MIRFSALSFLLTVSMTACSVANEAASGANVAPVDLAAPPADAMKMPSGLVSRVLKVGRGSIHPGPRAHVLVEYTGWTTDGEVFDSSSMRGRPQGFDVEDVVAGWAEGLQLMVVGEKRRFWIPGSLAFDKLDRPGAPRGTLVFDIELLALE